MANGRVGSGAGGMGGGGYGGGLGGAGGGLGGAQQGMLANSNLLAAARQVRRMTANVSFLFSDVHHACFSSA